MSYVNLTTTSVDITVENCIFTITTETVKSNYPTLPIKKMKILLLKDSSLFDGKWHLPLSNFDISNNKQPLHFLNINENVFSQHLGLIENNLLSEINSYSSVYFSLVDEVFLENISLPDGVESSLFSIEELKSMDLPKHQLSILFGFENINGNMSEGAISVLQREILTSTLAKVFLPTEFTIAELLLIIQAVVPDFSVPKPNFVTRLTDCKARSGMLIELLDEEGNLKKTNKYSQKPAQLYSFNDEYIPKKLSIYNNFN